MGGRAGRLAGGQAGMSECESELLMNNSNIVKGYGPRCPGMSVQRIFCVADDACFR